MSREQLLITSATPVRKVIRGKKGGRLQVVAARVSSDEYARLDHKAREAGLSIGSYIRACSLGDAGPRARRSPPVNAELLGAVAGQLNRAGNNLNQLMHYLNAAQAVGARETIMAVEETREAVRRICDILGGKATNDRQGQHTL